MSGVLSVSGTPDQAVVPWGRQSFNAASIIAALTGLACVRGARLTGTGQLADISAQEATTTSVEQIWFQYHYDDMLPFDKIAPRQGSLHWSRGYLVLPCRTGACMITPTPAPAALLEWLIEQGRRRRGRDAATRGGTHPRRICRRWLPSLADSRCATMPLGCSTRPNAATSPGVRCRPCATSKRTSSSRSAAPSCPTADMPSVRRAPLPDRVHRHADAATIGARRHPMSTRSLADWGRLRRSPHAGPFPSTTKPLDGIRVLDFSWVLAGPFGCRLLGDLGADVVKLQTRPGR